MLFFVLYSKILFLSILHPSVPCPLSTGSRKSVLYVCEPVSVLKLCSFVLYFRFRV